MDTRRNFIRRMAIGAAAIGSLDNRTLRAAPEQRSRNVWILSDAHVGHTEDGLDGAEWLTRACKDIRGAAAHVDYALMLGDLVHGGSREQFKQYLEVRASSGIAKWHELAGNHEYQGGKLDAYNQLIGSSEPYLVIDGNLAWFFISDEQPGVPGNFTEASCEWLEKNLAAHADKNIIVCSHQLVHDTVDKSNNPQRHIHPAERIAGILDQAKVDLWLCGHEHHAPYRKENVVRKNGTTFINVASVSHAYRTKASQSFLFEIREGENRITARRRQHDTASFLPEFEVDIPLRHPVQLESA